MAGCGAYLNNTPRRRFPTIYSHPTGNREKATMTVESGDAALPEQELRRFELELQQLGQERLLRELQQASGSQHAKLLQQLLAIDFSLLREIRNSGFGAACRTDRVLRARIPQQVMRQPQTAEQKQAWALARQAGEQLLRSSAVAVVTVAGGQGTRLGFDLPKGMYPVGPVSGRTLFQIFAEQILARRRRYAAALPWLIMTSDATHSETIRFFEAQQYFGLPTDSVHFFRQGSLPAIDAVSGEILLSGPGEIALAPDGHGGLVGALARSGLLNQLRDSGVEHIYYHQIDNPTAPVADPALLGFHQQFRSQATTCVVPRTTPAERMGVVVEVDERAEIIEYSELTPEQSASVNEAGEWIFWAGNTAIHVFDRSFLEQLTMAGNRLPLHAARKNVPFVDRDGQLRTPTDAANPNAIKLEQFIFDALPLARATLVVEGHRDREFNPVKNRSGADSVDSCRAAMVRIAREWLTAAGVELPESVAVEISPLQALDAEELRHRLAAGELHIDHLMTAGELSA